MALTISKHIEMKTGISIQKFIRECKKITGARLENKITGKEIRIRAASTPAIPGILKKIDLLT